MSGNLGLEEYNNDEPFEASMLVHFRERLGAEIVDKINRKIVKKPAEEEVEGKKSSQKRKTKIAGD